MAAALIARRGAWSALTSIGRQARENGRWAFSVVDTVRRLEGQGVLPKQTETIQEASFSKFKSEMQSSQEKQFLSLQCEIEKIIPNIKLEIHSIKTQIEAVRTQIEKAKIEVIKYYIGIIASLCGVGVAVMKITNTSIHSPSK